jgi:serine/threonine protein kinase
MKSNTNNLGIVDNRYILLKELGSGYSSTVYKARDSTDNKEYALKLLNHYDEKIENEIKINKIIKDSETNLFTKYITSSVGYYDKGESKELRHYIILELASKGTVLDYIKKDDEGLEEKLCKLFFAKILIIIQTLHQMGICHRDLKLENFLFDENFNIKLSDFGFSSLVVEDKKGKKKKQTDFLGTPYYVAPEILMQIPYDGEKVDIFSLGVILFNIRTCKYGFEKASKNNRLYKLLIKNTELYWEVLGQKIEIDGLSKEFKDLFIKMVSFDPNQRPTIAEIYNDEWMKEIRDLNHQELMDLEQELIKELKRRE